MNEVYEMGLGDAVKSYTAESLRSPGKSAPVSLERLGADALLARLQPLGSTSQWYDVTVLDHALEFDQ